MIKKPILSERAAPKIDCDEVPVIGIKYHKRLTLSSRINNPTRMNNCNSEPNTPTPIQSYLQTLADDFELTKQVQVGQVNL